MAKSTSVVERLAAVLAGLSDDEPAKVAKRMQRICYDAERLALLRPVAGELLLALGVVDVPFHLADAVARADRAAALDREETRFASRCIETRVALADAVLARMSELEPKAPAFCDFCAPGEERGLEHAKTRDGRWVCDACFLHRMCSCMDLGCKHRPELGVMPEGMHTQRWSRG